eukprot:TRINITY_DN2419_c4_g1_i1.p1 TRINITY_DN2419_c4_g1~~TRINITY_DN2419_c4_g1_i1.p1  ORF type:complete len:793 (+),score=184.99 TRINITY_DN2419_c4_g1_i1:96-2381(+)
MQTPEPAAPPAISVLALPSPLPLMQMFTPGTPQHGPAARSGQRDAAESSWPRRVNSFASTDSRAGEGQAPVWSVADIANSFGGPGVSQSVPDQPEWWQGSYAYSTALPPAAGSGSRAHGAGMHASRAYGHFAVSLARLPLWYQLGALLAAGAVLWNSDDLAAGLPIWKTFFEAFVEPALELFRMDVYVGLGPSDRRVRAKERTLMIGHAVLLLGAFHLLRRLSARAPVVARVRKCFMFVFSAEERAREISVVLTVAGASAQAGEVLLAVRGVATAGSGDGRLAHFWAAHLAAWWLGTCVLPWVACMLQAGVCSCRAKASAAREAADASLVALLRRWRLLAAAALRIAAGAGAPALSIDVMLGELQGDLFVACLAVQALVAHAARNLSTTALLQQRLAAAENQGQQSPTTPGLQVQELFATPPPAANEEDACPLVEEEPADAADRWATARAAWGYAAAPLEGILGVLVVVHAVSVMPLLVVLLLLFLVLVAFPAGVDAFHTDVFVHVSALIALGWYQRQAEGSSWRGALLVFAAGVTVHIGLAYAWRLTRTYPRTAASAAACLLAAAPRDWLLAVWGYAAAAQLWAAERLTALGRLAGGAWAASGAAQLRAGAAAAGGLRAVEASVRSLLGGRADFTHEAFLGSCAVLCVLLALTLVGWAIARRRGEQPPSPRRGMQQTLPGLSDLIRMCTHSGGSLLLTLAAWAPAQLVRGWLPRVGGNLVTALVFLTAYGYVVPWRAEVLSIIDHALHAMPAPAALRVAQ